MRPALARLHALVLLVTACTPRAVVPAGESEGGDGPGSSGSESSGTVDGESTSTGEGESTTAAGDTSESTSTGEGESTTAAGETSESGTSSTTSGDDESTGTTAAGDAGDSGSSTDATTGSGSSEGGACEGPGVPLGEACDPYAQDCEGCSKCNPWYDLVASASADKCVAIDPDPQDVGEPCAAIGDVLGGVDNCVEGATCMIDQTATGKCVELCSGSPETPECDTPDTVCVVTSGGAKPLCLAPCDPVVPDCDAGDGCYPVEDAFYCILDASGNTGGYADECMFINACDPGLACVVAQDVPGCLGSWCCSPLCDIDLVDACPVGLSCTPWWQPGTAPEGLDHVGVCSQP